MLQRFIVLVTFSFLIFNGLFAGRFAWGHGFDLILASDANANPTGFYTVSQSQYFDLYQATDAPSNMFIESFEPNATTISSGSYYSATHGFAETAGPWPTSAGNPTWTASFNVVSPLLFSNGTIPNGQTRAVAVSATNGTYLNMYDRYQGLYPGASSSSIQLPISGTTSFATGFGVSLYDAHELSHDLYLAATSTQTYGAYGFAYEVTVHFANGTVLTTQPLVATYAISSPQYGDFSDNASVEQQDAAAQAIYNAVAPVTTWKGGSGSAWSSSGNWTNGVGGASTGTTSAATIIFNSSFAVQPVLDSNSNLQNITFTSVSLGATSITATSGHSLLLSSGGTIQTTSTVVNPQAINCPLVIQGTNGSYTLSSNADSTSATLTVGGGISAGAVGNTILMLSGSNSGANVVSGAITNGSATSLALYKIGDGTWTLTANNSYSGGTNLLGGKLNVNHPHALGSGLLVFGGGSLDNTSGSALSLSTNNAQTWNADIAFQGTNSLNVGSGNVTLTGDRTINVVANTLTLGGTISDAGQGYSLTKTGAGTCILTGTLNYSGNTTVSQGSLSLSNITGTNRHVTVGSNATLTVNSISGGSPTNGAIVTIQGDANNQDALLAMNSTNRATPTTAHPIDAGIGGATGTMVLASLNISNADNSTNGHALPTTANPFTPGSALTTSFQTYYGTLDLANNNLVVAGGQYSQIQDMARSASHIAFGGTWDGMGLTSSWSNQVTPGGGAANHFNGSTALGVIINNGDQTEDPSVTPFEQPLYATSGASLGTTFEGYTGLTGNETLVKYTWVGDANLDGKVDLADYNLFAAGVSGATASDGLPGWYFGDFNYDGLVDLADYNLLAAGISASNNSTISLPEPSTFVLAAFGLLGLLAARRRAKV